MSDKYNKEAKSMYKYETHLHSAPVSACAVATVREHMEFYKSKGYDGIFITNHFIDGNICHEIREGHTYEEMIEYYFSDYEEAKKLEEEIGVKVFSGVETSYGGTDFLIYGLDKEWYLAHPEIREMRRSQLLSFYIESGALVIQAHPFREAGYIDHIRLFPRHIHGTEVVNAGRNEFENRMAKLYAEKYNLLEFAGSDNHCGRQDRLAGMESEEPVLDEKDFVEKVKNGKMRYFYENCEV